MPEACQGRVALVTGASRGIGAALARRLAAEGARVALVARTQRKGEHRLPGSLEETARSIEEAGGRALAVPADLADPAVDRAALVDRVEAELGPVDILVNNAAVAFYARFLEITERQVQIAHELNVRTPWQLARRVLPGMIERRRGWILNVTSVAARAPSGPPFEITLPARRGTLYGSTKCALDRWTSGLAAEMHRYGIAVNALAPEAAVATPGAVEAVALPAEAVEPVETMCEAALYLCTCSADEHTGRIDTSLSLLAAQRRPVHTLDGRSLLPGWQPADLPRRLA